MKQQRHTDHHIMQHSIEVLCAFVVMVLCWLATANSAGACDVHKVPFGIGAKTLKINYGIEAPELSGVGEDLIQARGKSICSELKPQVTAELILVDDQLIKIVFEDMDASDVLLPIAEKAFGKAYNQPNPNKPGEPFMQNVWDDDSNDRVAMYSYHKRGSLHVQLLEVASKKHAKLFKKIAEKAERIADEVAP